jgi:hypothetical protein
MPEFERPKTKETDKSKPVPKYPAKKPVPPTPSPKPKKSLAETKLDKERAAELIRDSGN